jgi:hypothetical protein
MDDLPYGCCKDAGKIFSFSIFTSVVGVNFSYLSQKMKSITYMGDGPYRVWKNRMKGTQFGL